jgi:hypothetical protein
LVKLNKDLVIYYTLKEEERPYIHLTFLDAYTPFDEGKDTYGNLVSYPEHYAEHYVDDDIILPDTDACLSNAFNFYITHWRHGLLQGGHQWPRHWYEKSVTRPGFKYGYSALLSVLTQYTEGNRCDLFGKDTNCEPAPCG